MLKSSNFWSNVFDIETKREKLKTLAKDFEDPAIWQNKSAALTQQQEIVQIKETLDLFDGLKKSTDDLKELVNYLTTEKEEKDFSHELALLKGTFRRQIQKLFLADKYDSCSAVMVIQAGAGGRDAEDWAAMLLRMYQKYCEEKKWLCKILSQTLAEGGGPEGRIGLKEAVLAIKGEFVYGLLKKETGVHRLVRISPFSAKKLRQTSFAQVEVAPQLSDKTSDVNLRQDDLKIETFRAAGHGGQNVNKRETAVRLTHLPTGLVASSQVERTQIMNKKIAMNFLLAKLAALQETQRQQEIQDEKSKMRQKIGSGKKRTADFGQQIRSYILHPYKLVKDHRTLLSVSDTEAVLNGDLEQFIQAEIKRLV